MYVGVLLDIVPFTADDNRVSVYRGAMYYRCQSCLFIEVPCTADDGRVSVYRGAVRHCAVSPSLV